MTTDDRTRADILRDWFIGVLTPAARRLDRMHPNSMSLVALAVGVAAGACYWQGHRLPVLFAVGGLLAGASGVLDGLDGVMARLHGRTSRLGDFLDHFYDRLVEIAIFGGLALSPYSSLVLGLGVVIVVVLNSYLGTQIQASFGRRFYTGVGKAELFAALVVGSLLLAFNPDVSLTVLELQLTPIDLFFLLVVVMAMQAMVHRVRLAHRLAGEERGAGEA